jgi:hypothetical protein
VTSATSRATVHNAAFPACQTPGFIGETEGSSVQFSTSSQESVHKSSQQRVIKVSSLLEVTFTSEVK